MKEQLEYCKAFNVKVKDTEDKESDFVFISIDKQMGENWIRDAAKENNLEVISLDETEDFYVYEVFFSEPIETEDGSVVYSDIMAHIGTMSFDDINNYYKEQEVTSIEVLYQPKQKSE